ncbi:hypothetical protein BOX15_Mlig015635g3, partial [Macrostomum lignano]
PKSGRPLSGRRQLPPLPIDTTMSTAVATPDLASTNNNATFSSSSDEAVKNQWRPCAEWLFRCLENVPDILQTAQTVLGDPQATVVDLLSLLKDGILLCHILPALSCNDITLKTLDGFKLMTLNSPFVFKKNIGAFLNQCESYFGLKRSDLFRAEDLLEQENIIGIIDALSTLSRCPRARQSGIAGFEIARCSPQAESDYYSFVADSVPEPAPVHSKHRLQQKHGTDQQQQQQQLNQAIADVSLNTSGVSSCCSQQVEEKVYDCIINLRGKQPQQPQQQQQQQKQQQQQQQQQPVKGLTPQDLCIQEMVDTERNYVETLRLLVEDVMQPMKAKQSAWSADEVDTIFKFLPELSSLHQKLLQELQIAVVLKPEHAKSLPQVFSSFKDRMLVYGQYSGHLARAQKLVENACKCDKRKSDELQQHLSNCRALFKLSEYLTVPVQRVLKYHLLLRSLISIEEKLAAQPQQQQSASQLDLSQLREAHEAMCEVADYVNEVKRDLEMMALIDQIQNTIDDLDLPPSMRLIDYGRLQIDEELKVANDPNRPTSGSKLRYCFLWNRICMLVKSRGPGKEGYIFKNVFAIKTDLVIKPIDCPPTGKKSVAQLQQTTAQQQVSPQQQQQPQPAGNTKWTWLFSVSDQPQPQQQQQQQGSKDGINMVFIAKTKESRRRWLEAFQRSKEVLAPPNFNMFGHYFEPATFDLPTYCSVCNRLILGCFYQGYRCRKTGKKVHPACIPSRPDRSNSEIIAPRFGEFGAGANSAPGGPNSAPAVQTRHSTDATEFSPSAPNQLMPLRIPAAVIEEFSPSPKPQPVNGDQPPPAPDQITRRFSRGGSTDSTGHPLDHHDWFVGPMSREMARDALLGQPVGTFLVRLSLTSSMDYAISLRYRETIKHMRIQQASNCYYLGEIRTFPSIPALVEHYSLNSLCECFTDLDATLARPIKLDLPRPLPPPPPPPTQQQQPPAVYSRSNSQSSGLGTAQPASGAALLGTSTPRRSSVVGYALALRDYAVPGHLALVAGETVTLLGQCQPAGVNGTLWRGRRANGSVGVFSPEVVQLVSTPGTEFFAAGGFAA